MYSFTRSMSGWKYLYTRKVSYWLMLCAVLLYQAGDVFSQDLPFVTFNPGDKVVEGETIEVTCGPRTGQGDSTGYTLRRGTQNLASDGQAYQLTVNRVDNAASFTCSTPGDLANVSSTLTVYYGPNSAEIFGNVQVVANGKNQMTLMCVSDAVNPEPQFAWINATGGQEIPTNPPIPRGNGGFYTMLTLTPNRYQEGNLIKCEIRNPQVQGIVKSANVALNLTYPPLGEPVLSVDNNTVVYSGDQQRVECRVRGGKPLPKVAWTCNLVTPTLRDTVNGDTVVSEMTMTVPVGVAEVTCQCKATHKTNLYSPAVTLQLNVHYPPSKPRLELFPGSTQLENQDIQASCISSQPVGNPLPTYNIYKKGQKIAELAHGVQQKSLGPVSREDNKASFYCEAVNEYVTAKKVPAVRSDDIILDVHYGPRMNLDVGSTVTIREGESKDIECSADSNPRSQLSWQSPKGTTSQGGVLSLKSIHRADQGVYVCNASAKSEALGVGLANAITFKLVVHYPPKVFVRIDRLPSSGFPKFVCSAHGEPNRITFRKWRHSRNGVLLRELQGTKSGDDNVLVISSPTGQDTGQYFCSVTNNIPDLKGNLVQNASKAIEIEDVPMFENVSKGMEVTGAVGQSVTLTSRFYSYPAYYNASWVTCDDLKIVSTSSEGRFVQQLKKSEVSLSIFGRNVQSQGHTSELMIKKAVAADSAKYCLIVCNEKECDRSAEIRLTVTAVQSQPKQGSLPIIPIAAGAGAFVVLLILIIVVACVCKRKKRAKPPKQNITFVSAGMGADFIRKSRDAIAEETEPLKNKGANSKGKKEKIYFAPSQKSPGPAEEGGFPLLGSNKPVPKSQNGYRGDADDHPDSEEEPQHPPEPQDDGRWRDSDGLVYLQMDFSNKKAGMSTFKPRESVEYDRIDFAPRATSPRYTQDPDLPPPPPPPSQTQGIKHTAM